MALSFEFAFLKWGYGPMNGPNKWTEMYPAARGKRQSPIDVVTREAAPGQVEEVRVETRPCSLLHLENTGVSWQLHFHDSLTSVISGGALPGHFKVSPSVG